MDGNRIRHFGEKVRDWIEKRNYELEKNKVHQWNETNMNQFNKKKASITIFNKSGSNFRENWHIKKLRTFH